MQARLLGIGMLLGFAVGAGVAACEGPSGPQGTQGNEGLAGTPAPPSGIMIWKDATGEPVSVVETYLAAVSSGLAWLDDEDRLWQLDPYGGALYPTDVVVYRYWSLASCLGDPVMNGIPFPSFTFWFKDAGGNSLPHVLSTAATMSVIDSASYDDGANGSCVDAVTPSVLGLTTAPVPVSTPPSLAVPLRRVFVR